MDASSVFFHATGYLRVPALLTADQVGMLSAATDRAVGPVGDSAVFPESPGRQRRIDNAVAVDPVFLDFASSERMVRVLRPILGPDIELVENRHNHVRVYPVAAVDRLHRDVLHWSRSILTALVYVSDCTEAATATRVVPGSHLWPSTGAPNNGGTWLEKSHHYAELVDQAVTVPARAGDALLLHGQLYHAGAGGSAAGPRIVFTLAYRSSDELAQHDPPHCRLVSGRRVYRGRGVTTYDE